MCVVFKLQVETCSRQVQESDLLQLAFRQRSRDVLLVGKNEQSGPCQTLFL